MLCGLLECQDHQFFISTSGGKGRVRFFSLLHIVVTFWKKKACDVLEMVLWLGGRGFYTCAAEAD